MASERGQYGSEIVGARGGHHGSHGSHHAHRGHRGHHVRWPWWGGPWGGFWGWPYSYGYPYGYGTVAIIPGGFVSRAPSYFAHRAHRIYHLY